MTDSVYISNSEKAAVKLAVLSQIADRLIQTEHDCASSVDSRWYTIDVPEEGKQQALTDYALAFLADCFERLFDDIADV